MISHLSARRDTHADTTDGKVTNRALCLPNPRKSIVYLYSTRKEERKEHDRLSEKMASVQNNL